jgi:hypothetical protein
VILQNAKIGDAALPDVRVNGGGRWTTRGACMDLDLAIAYSYVPHGGGPNVGLRGHDGVRGRRR